MGPGLTPCAERGRQDGLASPLPPPARGIARGVRSQPAASRSRHRLALRTWMGVYPVLTAIALVLEPILIGMPVPMRTLVMSALMVPIMVYGVTPLISGNNLGSD